MGSFGVPRTRDQLMHSRQKGNYYFGLLTAVSFALMAIFVMRPDKGPPVDPTCKFCLDARSGIFHFVYAQGRHARDLSDIKKRGAIMCANVKPQCVVMIWDKKAFMPDRVPLTALQAGAEVARYSVDWTTGQQAACFVRAGQIVESTCQ